MGNYIDAHPKDFTGVDLLDPEAISRKLIGIKTPNQLKTLSKSPAQKQREAEAKAEREAKKLRKEAMLKEAKEKASRELVTALTIGGVGLSDSKDTKIAELEEQLARLRAGSAKASLPTSGDQDVEVIYPLLMSSINFS
jgi:hypothetical protein